MIEIQRRDFELQIQYDINVIVCFVSCDSKCTKCLEELDAFSKKTPEILFRKYDIIFDCDISETYEVYEAPYILIFKDNHVVNKFPYKDIEDFERKLDLKTLIKEKK